MVISIRGILMQFMPQKPILKKIMQNFGTIHQELGQAINKSSLQINQAVSRVLQKSSYRKLNMKIKFMNLKRKKCG
jgi:hypothetical protein